jgi:hypothetical protein
MDHFVIFTLLIKIKLQENKAYLNYLKITVPDKLLKFGMHTHIIFISL